MEENDYQIVHAIAGRMRVRAAWLETDQAASGKLQRLIEALNYVSSVRINPLAQSIIIIYQSGKISTQDAEAQFISAIHEVKPPPAAVEPSTETKQPEEIKRSEILHPPPQSAPPTKTPPDPAATSAIPSPWDEPDAAVNRHLHSTDSLAKRLNTTPQAISQHKSKSEFSTWTRGQDPEGISWSYDVASQSFHPIPPVVESSQPAAPSHRVEKSETAVGKTPGQ